MFLGAEAARGALMLWRRLRLELARRRQMALGEEAARLKSNPSSETDGARQSLARHPLASSTTVAPSPEAVRAALVFRPAAEALPCRAAPRLQTPRRPRSSGAG